MKPAFPWLLPMAACLALVSCSGAPADLPPLDELPRPLTVAEQDVAAASNRMGFGLLQRLDAESGGDNVFLSPLSVSFALGMALNGAEGPTFDSMRATLGFPPRSLEEVNQAYRSLLDLLGGLDRNTQFHVANAVWYDAAFGGSVKPDFLERSRQFFDAEVSGLDFADPGAPDVINGWVSRETGGRIPKIIERIEEPEVMFLVNAIDFVGTWSVAFDPKDTRDDTFRTVDATAPVRMMHLTDTLEYVEGEGFRAVDLRYGRGAYTMTVVLPAEGVGLDSLMAALDPEMWDGWTSGFTAREVALSLPRLRLSYGASLVDALKALGMEIAFDPGRADFSGIADVAPERLYLTRVDHRSFVEVDEAGTRAAAATNVGVGVTCACGPVEFRVDQPFLLAIRERFSGTVLFLGKIVKPPAA